MTTNQRRQDARIGREVQEFTEALASVVSRLDPAAAAGDEATYNAVYEAEFTPIYCAAQRAIGRELAQSCIKNAYALARVA